MNELNSKLSLYARIKRWRQNARRYAGRVFNHRIKLIHDAVVADESKRHPYDQRD